MANSKQNIVKDLGILTKLPNKVLDELIEKINLCIGSEIHDALENDEQDITLNIGIGILSIDLASMQCKFIPSKDLKATIKKCLATKPDPLELALSQELSEKLLAICDEAI